MIWTPAAQRKLQSFSLYKRVLSEKRRKCGDEEKGILSFRSEKMIKFHSLPPVLQPYLRSLRVPASNREWVDTATVSMINE